MKFWFSFCPNLLCLMRSQRLREAKRPSPPVAGRACGKPTPFALHPAVWVAGLGLSLSKSGDPAPWCLLKAPLCPLSCLFQKKSQRPSRRQVPQLRLPKPPALSTLYAHLHYRKIKILELFHKVDQGEHQISREEFIVALKAVSASPAPAGLRWGGGAHAPPQPCSAIPRSYPDYPPYYL